MIPYALRSGPSGPEITGPAGYVLTADASGLVSFQPPATPPAEAVPPFRATYYVDPAFTGTQLGSASNPFTTIAAALAQISTLAQTAATIFLAPGSAYAENIVMPTAGDFEIACQLATAFLSTTLNGTITLNASAQLRVSFTNLSLRGAINGSALSSAASARLRLTGCYTYAPLTLAASGGGIWRASFVGYGPPLTFGLGGRSFSAPATISVNGTIDASNWCFDSTISHSGLAEFLCCQLATPGGPASTLVGTATGQAIAILESCSFSRAPTFTASTGTYQVQLDGYSFASLQSFGVTFAGPVTTTTRNSNASITRSIANNVADTVIAPNAPAGLYQFAASQAIIAAGTSGTSLVKCTYTNAIGAPATTASGSALLITSPPGTESIGSFFFQHSGGPISTTTTGIITPGALNLKQAIVLTRLD